MALLLPATAAGQASTGITADPSVPQAEFSQFDGLPPGELWQEIDDLDYWAVPRQAPEDYYASVDQSSVASLRTSLHQLIDEHAIFHYSHSSDPDDANHTVDAWDILALADAHPNNPADIIDLYLNDTFDRQLRGPTTDPRYDREHSWPKSLGFPDDTRRNAAYSDCHHLFAAYSSYNGSRSNKPYGAGETDAEDRKPTLENLDRGGSLTDEPESSNYSFDDVWQTWIGRRGDVARAMFYMDVRYEGGMRDGVGEPDLQLTDDVAEVIARDVWETSGVAFMGLQSVLIQWHQQDPVDDLERRRNTVVYLFQGNRNPFIDHPEWVNVFFGDGQLPAEDEPVASTLQPWINEFHYDNAGADTGEFVEIAGPAGLDLSGWTVVGYNGSGGRRYATVELSGTIPDLQAGLGVLAFDFQGMQNGADDGLALVDPNGAVLELISYEGQFTATDGPANDQASEDVGVAEAGDTPAGHSLQRGGQGSQGDHFAWQAPASATRGAVNAGQSLGASN